MHTRFLFSVSLSFGLLFGNVCLNAQQKDESSGSDPISFYKQVRPIFQLKCFGCHQGAKQDGQYVMTDFAKLLAGGESGDPAIVPGKPDQSYLVELITPESGSAEMPREAEPLGDSELKLIRLWIQQGATDDTPQHARGSNYSPANPPRYQLLPTVTSLDVSPDGRWLAVAGFHEVILHRLQWKDTRLVGSQIKARLIGISERIESLKFSPDGKRLAVSGGSPARLGEIQVWDVDQKELLLSKQVGYDTLYGVAWSGDGKLVSFGCPDTTVRAIDSETGKQKLFNGAHNDWVIDTVFSTQNDHLITVSRDMSMKLIKVDTQRFVDNITSITPGALKGGLNAVDCHPQKDELLSAGADGVPRVYRMLRNKARKIGDDFNLIKAYEKLDGRVFDTRFSNSGKYLAAVSSFNGKGQFKAYDVSSGKKLASVNHESGGWFALDFFGSPSLTAQSDAEKTLVALSGFDGVVRIYDLSGKPILKFDSVPRDTATEK